jgi:hypothetical protein
MIYVGITPIFGRFSQSESHLPLQFLPGLNSCAAASNIGNLWMSKLQTHLEPVRNSKPESGIGVRRGIAPCKKIRVHSPGLAATLRSSRMTTKVAMTQT